LAAGAVLAVGGATTGIVLAAQGGGRAGPADAGAKAHAKPTLPLRLTSITPATHEENVDGTTPITVTYNQPLPVTAPLPTLSPAVAGSWQRSGDAVSFTPETGFAASTKVTVKVPGTTSANATSSFTTGKYSTLRLQEVLAQLGYLPFTWTPATGRTAPIRSTRADAGDAAAASSVASDGGLGGSLAQQAAAAYAPPSGSFAWSSGYPARLKEFWSRGDGNTLDQGAITGFEADHGMPTDGVAGPKVWQALLTAAAKDQRDTHGYSYAIASKSYPETLTIWHNGKKVFSSYANTGIGAAPTANGTFPVYEKLPFQIMQGTNPDGSHYADPVQWVSYFNGGEAVHYFPRYSFGFPQSLGCVELPYSAAKNAYPYLPYGTLVTVE
jgi:hypothetical protein